MPSGLLPVKTGSLHKGIGVGEAQVAFAVGAEIDAGFLHGGVGRNEKVLVDLLQGAHGRFGGDHIAQAATPI
jgi:hypothetical protein